MNLKKYLGVTFMKKISGPNRWRAQITRQGIALNLGCFPDPDLAARAHDNAAHHLANWAEYETSLNFPGETPGDATPATLRAMDKLKARFPNWERELQADLQLTEYQRVEKDAMLAIEHTSNASKRLRNALSWIFGQTKMLELRVKQLETEAEVKDRVIAGLRATGGHNPFRPIDPPLQGDGERPDRPAVPEIPVDSHLAL